MLRIHDSFFEEVPSDTMLLCRLIQQRTPLQTLLNRIADQVTMVDVTSDELSTLGSTLN